MQCGVRAVARLLFPLPTECYQNFYTETGDLYVDICGSFIQEGSSSGPPDCRPNENG